MVRLTGRSVCPKKVVDDFWDVHFSCVTVEVRVADSNMDGFASFPSNLFAFLAYYLEVEDGGMGEVAGNAVLCSFTLFS